MTKIIVFSGHLIWNNLMWTSAWLERQNRKRKHHSCFSKENRKYWDNPAWLRSAMASWCLLSTEFRLYLLQSSAWMEETSEERREAPEHVRGAPTHLTGLFLGLTVRLPCLRRFLVFLSGVKKKKKKIQSKREKSRREHILGRSTEWSDEKETNRS